MKCEFCREEFAEDALICPHCRKDTMRGRGEKFGRRLRWAAVLIGTPIGLLVLLAWCGSQMPEQSPSDRIAEACDREYPAGSEGNSRCKIALSVKAMDDIEKDKIESAARSAGVKP